MDERSAASRRGVSGLVVARVGRVAATGDPVLPWAVLDGAGTPVEPVSAFLRDLLACGSSAASCRSYGFDLLRWFRFLTAVDVAWHRAQRGDVRDFVLWLRVCHNPARDRHRHDAPAPGAVNPRTGKTSLRAGYAPATINHAVSVMSAFYEFHLLSGQGPVVSPVPPQARDGHRLQGHHNPLEPFRLHRRGAYRQKQPDAASRALPDKVVEDLFGALDCNRDRALFAMFLSSGARAGELLGMTVSDALPGDGRIYVRSKGLGGAKQACPTSPEAFAWMTLYLGELAQEGKRPGSAEPLWWTRRNPLRPLTYTALRAVMNRINARIGADITLHDLRHTLCQRLIEDPGISLVDVQHVMRHRWITTTSGYLRPRVDEVIARVQEHYNRPTPMPDPAPGWTYDRDDLAEVFGTDR